jgi:hypothetical protein
MGQGNGVSAGCWIEACVEEVEDSSAKSELWGRRIRWQMHTPNNPDFGTQDRMAAVRARN